MMKMAVRFVSAIVVCGVAVALSARADASTATARTLSATAGPGSRIALVNSAGNRVVRLRPGKYTIVIHDRSRVDNFQLVGGSITDVKKTGLRFVGTVRWHLQLGSGRYRYFSGAHPQTMQGRFRVA